MNNEYLELPADDRFYLVKWIDPIVPAFGTTRSAAMILLLQALPVTSLYELQRLTEYHKAVILRAPFNGQRNPSDFRSDCRVLAGSIPLICIGDVFHKKRIAHSFCATQKTMLLCRDDDDISLKVMSDMSQSQNTYGPRILNLTEYDGVGKFSPQSRCLFYTDGDTDFIIPRYEIFRRLFCPHTEMALAFTSGIWKETASRVIYTGPQMKNGYVTKIDPITKNYHVILQTYVQNLFAPLLAILYFDPYARSCANSIFTDQWRDERPKGPPKPTVCAARIPFRASPQAPIRLRVRGIKLWQSPAAREHGDRQKFLVTEILSCSYPTYLPLISFGRFNSGDDAEIRVKSDSPPPYRNYQIATPAGSDLAITAASDANQKKSEKFKKESGCLFTDLIEPGRLIKNIVTQSDRSRPIPPVEASRNMSSGELTSQKDDAASLRVHVALNEGDDRFLSLAATFQELQTDGRLQGVNVVGPILPWQGNKCSGMMCWHLLTEEQSRIGKIPKTGFRKIESEKRGQRSSESRRARSVCVIGLAGNGITGYWIEIEHGQNEHFKCLLLTGQPADEQSMLQVIMDEIVACEGEKMETSLPSALSDYGMGIHVFKHLYEAGSHTKIRPHFVEQKLYSVGILV